MKNVYDNPVFFNEYQSMRSEEINANNLLEVPIIKNMLPLLKGKSILDLGCGCGDMDKYFISKGAKKVVATDISINMINNAKEINNDKKIDYLILKMENISSIEEQFDIVYSSLAFHYIKDFNKLLSDINHLLKPGGILIFSQESPINTATTIEDNSIDNKVEINGKRYYLLHNYCKEGMRKTFWNNTFVTKYHRSYATIVNSLIKNNFNIIDITDSFANKDVIKLCEKFKYQIDKPYFTFIKASKKL